MARFWNDRSLYSHPALQVYRAKRSRHLSRISRWHWRHESVCSLTNTVRILELIIYLSSFTIKGDVSRFKGPWDVSFKKIFSGLV